MGWDGKDHTPKRPPIGFMVQGDEEDTWVPPSAAKREVIEMAYMQYLERKESVEVRGVRYVCRIGVDGVMKLVCRRYSRLVFVLVFPNHKGAEEVPYSDSEMSESDSEISESESSSSFAECCLFVSSSLTFCSSNDLPTFRTKCASHSSHGAFHRTERKCTIATSKQNPISSEHINWNRFIYLGPYLR